MADDLEARLQSHSRAFEGLLSLIPADLYYDKDRSDQWEKKKQTPEERRLAKKAKLNPANHKTAKDVMDENERKRRREEGEDIEDGQAVDVDAPRRVKPLQALKQEQPKTKVQKQKVEDDVHSKDDDAEDEPDDAEDEPDEPSIHTQLPKKSAVEKKREKDQKRKEKRAKKEEKEKAKQARKDVPYQTAGSKAEKPLDVLTTTEDLDEEEDAADLDNDMEAVDVAGLVPNEQADSAASESSAAESTFSRTTNQIPSSNSSVVAPTTKSDTSAGLSKNPAHSSTQATKPKPSPSEKEELLARLRAKLEAHRKARNADGLNGQPAKNRQELIEARRLKAEKRKALKKELRQQDKEQSKKAEMEAHLAELRGSPSIGSDMFGSRAGSMSPPQSNFSFGRVAFTDGETASSDLSKFITNGRKKGTSDPKAALQAAEKKQARLHSLDENKRTDIEQKDLWLNAKKKVHGEKVRDDTSLLKKTLKRKEKEKAKSSKEWGERKEGVSKSQEMKQKKREVNLAARKEGKGIKGKGLKGKKSGPKKKRPGFEGSFSGRSK